MVRSTKELKVRNIKRRLMEIGKELAELGHPGRDTDLAAAFKHSMKDDEGNWVSGSMMPWILNLLAEEATGINGHRYYHPEDYRDDILPAKYMGYRIINHKKGKDDLVQSVFDMDTPKLPSGWYCRLQPRAPAGFCADIMGGTVPFMDWLGPFETEDEAHKAADQWKPPAGNLHAKHAVGRASRYAAHEYLWFGIPNAEPHKLTEDEQRKQDLAKAGLVAPLVIDIDEDN